MPHQVAANPRKKRLVHAARQKRNPPNKKKGSLAKLLKLPLDVVFEILGHMDPGDVLLFARLTKELRGYLMHKSSISVWKKAWSNVPGFPDLPPAMSEPAWANLVFDRHCSACLARRVRLVHWRLRIRLCHLCDHKLVTKMRYRNDGGNPFRDLSWDKQEDWGYLIVTLIPARRTDYQFIYLTKDYQDTQAALLAITDPYAREEFIAECIERVSKIEQHAVLCESWTDDRFQEWIKEHHRIRLARVGAIMVKLMDLGYDIDILDEQNHKKFCRNPMVGRPQPMTPKVWDRIKHPLVRMLEDFKAERKAREFKQTLAGRKRFSLVVLRRFQNAWLSDLTVVNFQRSSLLVQSFIRSTFPVTIDDSYFAESAQDLLGGLLDEWRQTVQNYLLDQLACPPRIRDTFALGEYNSDWKTSESIFQALYLRLPLATTVFLCECSSDYWKTSSPTSALKPLFYPQVLGHICHTRAPALDLKDKTASSLILAAFRSSQGYPAPQAWDCSSLRLNTLLGEMVQRILQSAHLDPEVTTAQYMDGLDVYFACMTCAVQDEDEMELYETEAFGWKDALRHEHMVHLPTQQDVIWQCLTAEQVQEDRQDIEATWPEDGKHDEIPNRKTFEQALRGAGEGIEEAGAPGPATAEKAKLWFCAHCCDLLPNKKPIDLDDMKDHLKTKHTILEPAKGYDYYKDYSSPRCGYEDMPQGIRVALMYAMKNLRTV